MSTMTAARRTVNRKVARRTARPDAPFGAGLLRFVPFAVTYPDHFEPSDEDKAAAVLMFAAADEPDYDAMAGEASYLDWCAAMTLSPSGFCRSCGDLSEVLTDGLCPGCDI